MWRSECRVVGCRDGREPQIFSKLEGGGREGGGREGGGREGGRKEEGRTPNIG